MPEPLLDVRDLRVHFPTDDGLVKAVDGLTFSIMPGETLGVVGESGSGKSVSFLTVMGLITARQAQIQGEVIFEGVDLVKLPKEEMRNIRGLKIGMVFQDPMTSLHPFYKVGNQIAEAILAHRKIGKKEAMDQAVDMLRRVGIPRPDERARQYPHEFSGGMRQRAMIAMALSLNPDLLIADEPTTALDVTV
ncbi:MAG TPA: ABC transporter ATP-binding protein, partial [Actinomycetota bacterium]|nr:ABC transporter ATP-binding protein [Actinomycetota bacterium]